MVVLNVHAPFTPPIIECVLLKWKNVFVIWPRALNIFIWIAQSAVGSQSMPFHSVLSWRRQPFCKCGHFVRVCAFFFLFSNAILSPHLPCNAQLTVFFYYKQRTQTCLITTVETTWVPFACYLSTFFFPCKQYNFFGFVFLVGVGENHGQIKNKLYEKRGLKLEEQGCHFNNSMICVDSQSFSWNGSIAILA